VVRERNGRAMAEDKRLKSNIFDTALIFEGGGMRVSYTSGFATMLLEQRLFFNYVAGISAGSSLAVNYLSRDIERTRRCVTEFVSDPSFGDLKTWLKGEGFFNSDYIYSESARQDGVMPYNYDAFCRNEAECVIGAFKRDFGEMVYWRRKDYQCLDDLIVRVRASSTVPYLMPVTKIDDIYYVDGGLGTGIPFEPAMEDGYQRFVFVLTRERGFRLSPPIRLRILDAVLNNRPIEAEALLTRYERYNRALERIEELEREGRAYVFYPEALDVSLVDRDEHKLLKQYLLGHEQAYRELPRLLAFLGREK